MLRTSYLFYDYFKVDTFFSHAVFFSGATGRHMMSHILFSNFKFDAICVTFLHKFVQNRAVGTYARPNFVKNQLQKVLFSWGKNPFSGIPRFPQFLIYRGL